jgi:hypothetical protein
LQSIDPFGKSFGFAEFDHGNIVAIRLHLSRNLWLMNEAQRHGWSVRLARGGRSVRSTRWLADSFSRAVISFHAPQHFLNFLPLPHGQGWFRPIASSARHGSGGCSSCSKSEMSSGSPGSMPAITCQPCALQMATISSNVWGHILICELHIPA